jgi:phage shock protein PspC (stress-responsive transcriptional regulator)
METKKLRRSVDEKVIGGVAGGLGDYFDTDPVIFRILFVVLAFTGGGGVLIYLLMWIFIPLNKHKIHFQKDQNQTNSTTYDENGASETEFHAESEEYVEVDKQTLKRKKNGNLVGGSILIFVGLFFLADDFLPWLRWEYLWPVALIIAGLAIVKINYEKKK